MAKELIFYTLTLLVAITGVVMPALIAESIINSRYVVFSLFAIGSIPFLFLGEHDN
jgi:hypothetical protein